MICDLPTPQRFNGAPVILQICSKTSDNDSFLLIKCRLYFYIWTFCSSLFLIEGNAKVHMRWIFILLCYRRFVLDIMFGTFRPERSQKTHFRSSLFYIQWKWSFFFVYTFWKCNKLFVTDDVEAFWNPFGSLQNPVCACVAAVPQWKKTDSSPLCLSLGTAKTPRLPTPTPSTWPLWPVLCDSAAERTPVLTLPWQWPWRGPPVGRALVHGNTRSHTAAKPSDRYSIICRGGCWREESRTAASSLQRHGGN